MSGAGCCTGRITTRRAGAPGAVTISTNMAGRGVDIMLGGNPEQLAHAAAAKKQEARRAHLQSFVDRFRYKASKAVQAQSRLQSGQGLAQIAARSRGGRSRPSTGGMLLRAMASP